MTKASTRMVGKCKPCPFGRAAYSPPDPFCQQRVGALQENRLVGLQPLGCEAQRLVLGVGESIQHPAGRLAVGRL